MEPLKMGAVTITPEAAQQLAQCWAATSASPHSLYASAEEFTALLEQVRAACRLLVTGMCAVVSCMHFQVHELAGLAVGCQLTHI